MNYTLKSKTMDWYTRFIIILPLICAFFVFANESGKNINKTTSELERNVVDENNKSTVTSPEPELEAVTKKYAEKEEKSLVEVTEALEEEEDETFAYTPAIAPATPLASVFLVSPSMSLQTEYETSISKIMERSPKTDDVNLPEPVVKGDEETQTLLDDVKLVSNEVDGALPPSSQLDNESNIVTAKTTSITNDPPENPKITDPNSPSTKGNDTITDSTEKSSKEADLPSVRSNKQLNLASESFSDKNNTHVIQPTLNVKKSNNEENVDNSIKLSDEVEGAILLPDLSNKELIEEKEKGNVPNNETRTDDSFGTLDVNKSEGISNETIKEKVPEKPVVVEPPPEVVEPPQEDKKMLSFAEWKKRLDKEKVEEETIDMNSDVQKNKTQKVKKQEKRKHKIRKNFASIDCGGKVVSANKEASNILSVLKDDKDAYMLNPCNVKAWFVVELCDRIQIDSIDIANFEMFSSTPSSFIVYVTSRYPSGSWEKVGIFDAGPEKQIQTYNFDEKFYGRYIKIEIKKYHGKEHYCPLSLLRVFGITEVEQFEDDSESDNSNEETNTDEAEHPEHIDENSGNIFQAAKNVVADIVNGMAKKLSGKSESETNESGIIISQDESEKSLVVTVTALDEDPPIQGKQNGTRYFKDSFKIGENVIDWDMWYYYRLPKKTCSKEDYKRFIKNITATVYFNNSQSTFKPTVVLEHIAKTPLSIKNASQRVIVSQTLTESISKSEVTPSEVQKATEMIKKTEATELPAVTPFLSVVPLEKPTIKLPTSTVVAALSESSVVPNTPIKKFTNTTKSAVNTKPNFNEDSVDVLEFQINDTKGAVVASKIDLNASTTVSTENKTHAEDLTKDSNSTKENDETLQTLLIPQKDIADDKPVPHERQNILEVSKPVVIKSSSSSSSLQIVPIPVSEVPEKSSPSVLPEAVAESSTITIEVHSPQVAKSKDKKSEVNSEIQEKETQTSAKTTSGSKESIIAKLNTKVKALQSNLTMSMMYLDEMSEQYRTAVANVDTRYKMKTMALNASIQQQQLIIRQQTYLISNLTNQVDILVFQLQNLTTTTQEQYQRIIETHATWVFLEITIILIFLLLCRGKTRSYNDDNYDDRESDMNSRRFSEPVMIKRQENLMIERPLIRRQLSDPTGLFEHNQSASSTIAKKRKRRKATKANSLDLSNNLDANTCNNGDLAASNNKAGLIFGRGLFTGLAGAFTRKKDAIPQISRQADALLDEVTEKIHNSHHQLRKARSSELPTVIEEDQTIENPIPRPKSCEFLMNEGKKNKNRLG